MTSGPSASLPLPAIVRGEVRHARFHPIKHQFRYRAHQWLVDVDDPQVAPRWLRPLASFEARDHVGGPGGTLGANVRAFIAEQGVPWTAHRVIMLANARVLGYVFDPLTVFWCYAADGTFEGVLAEVHNTYGERHGYVLDLDSNGTARTDKQFYVSPFFGVFGDYQLKFVLDAEAAGEGSDAQHAEPRRPSASDRSGGRAKVGALLTSRRRTMPTDPNRPSRRADPRARVGVFVTSRRRTVPTDPNRPSPRADPRARVGAFVTLRQDDRVVFTGSFTGNALPVTTRRLLGVALTQPLMPQRVAALIRLHGVWLWLRRLPVIRRPTHADQSPSP